MAWKKEKKERNLPCNIAIKAKTIQVSNSIFNIWLKHVKTLRTYSHVPHEKWKVSSWSVYMQSTWYEPQHGKTNKMSARTAKTQVRVFAVRSTDQSLRCALNWLGGCPGWSEFFAGRICHFVGFVMRRLIFNSFPSTQGWIYRWTYSYICADFLSLWILIYCDAFPSSSVQKKITDSPVVCGPTEPVKYHFVFYHYYSSNLLRCFKIFWTCVILIHLKQCVIRDSKIRCFLSNQKSCCKTVSFQLQPLTRTFPYYGNPTGFLPI